MNRTFYLTLVLLFAASCSSQSNDENPPAEQSDNTTNDGFVGSLSCRECHEEFYKKWETSHHGRAMQPFTPELARTQLKTRPVDIKIGDLTFKAVFDDKSGHVLQTGPNGEKRYPIEHVMGGKNVYYFLTTLEKGRLQVLPISYDLRTDKWYDTASSGVRHFSGLPADSPLFWTDPAYTFNTSCYGCHVSQLATNYDPKNNSYNTVWAEPGINCETCHGPGAEHVKVCRAAPKDKPPKDLKIISTDTFTTVQLNDTCSTCHARLSPLSKDFTPGDRYFDHYDLITIEHNDFYPDGRDLGENYTLTSWMMSPCVKSGKLKCTHCHTSSGRYRFTKPGTENNACMPCHSKRVKNAKAHHRHKEGTPGSRCVDCHMPTTSFAQMMRSDHSMRPPTPATTLAYKSPNACNLCHTKKKEDAKWADALVRKWHSRDYQAPTLRLAELVAAARKEDWSKLDDILAYISDPKSDVVFKTGLIRLLVSCPDSKKWPVLTAAMKDASPLVRASAASELVGNPSRSVVSALLNGTEDDYRLVRIRSASALARHPRQMMQPKDIERLERASRELVDSLKSRLDDWASHYNMGNYLSDRGDVQAALKSYKTAIRLRPDAVPPLINASMIYARQRQPGKAEDLLRQAIKAAPNSAPANFNFGLLLAEKGDIAGAEKHLRKALKADPNMSQAAFNLGIILAKDRLKEAMPWLKKAYALRPDLPRYGYSLAFYLDSSGSSTAACTILDSVIRRHPNHTDSYMLLCAICEKTKQTEKAKRLYRQALKQRRLPPAALQHMARRLQAISN